MYCIFVILFVKSIFLTAVAVPTGCPKIITRDEWKARSPREPFEKMAEPADYVFIHHTAGPRCHFQSECAALVLYWQSFHQNIRGWNDIGYSFLAGDDGQIYEGRGWGVVGAHTLGYNSKGIGISINGNFMNEVPLNKTLQAVQQLIECGVQQGKIKSGYRLLGHRDAKNQTDCPGDKLYNIIQSWPHFAAKPGSS